MNHLCLVLGHEWGEWLPMWGPFDHLLFGFVPVYERKCRRRDCSASQGRDENGHVVDRLPQQSAVVARAIGSRR